MTENSSELIRQRLRTPKARLSYPYLFTPKRAKKDGEKDKFCTALIFEEGADLKPMKETAMRVAQARWPDAPNLIRAGRMRWPFRGDPEDVREKGYPLGSTFMNVSAGENRPGVVDASKNNVTDSNEAYAGRYVFVSLTAYTYDVNGNRGVTFGLNNVQLLEHGERLDGRLAAADEFDVEDTGVEGMDDLGEEAVDAPTSQEDALSDLLA